MFTQCHASVIPVARSTQSEHALIRGIEKMTAELKATVAEEDEALAHRGMTD